MSKFKSTMRKGFQLTFENGLTASVQFGAGNYCDNYHSGDFRFETDQESETAEVAVIFNNQLIDANAFVPEDKQTCDTVIGWLTADDVADFLMQVRNAQVRPDMYK